jgi:internalin A
MKDQETLKIISKAAAEKSSRLNLSGKNLSELPIEITQLSDLKQLLLSKNELRTLPSAFINISQLTYVDLSSNQLSKLPPEIINLPQISWLSLADNKLTQLPSGIGKLSQLKQLVLSDNQLSELLPEVANLSQLTHLILNNNQLTQLPRKIVNLSQLKSLELRNNRLSEIPLEIAQLVHLTRLDLRGNPLPIPPEILDKVTEPSTILNYYQELQKAQSKKSLNEIKILVVGQGGVGKTSLIKRLMDESINPDEKKTEGINVSKRILSLDKENEKNVQVNIWDFGGQEIMHATHQFFLTKRSIYLLVLDNRADQEANRVEYWLKIIDSFSDNSPIIIVGNKKDQHILDIDKQALSKHFNIKSFVETSCVNNEGIDKLKQTIITEIGLLPHIRDEIPLSWFLVKQKIEAMSKTENYIPYEEFEDICQQEGISEELSQRTLLGFLHDLGVVLNFQDDPRLADKNILNPKWITDAVYKILNDHELIVESKGVLRRDKMKDILDLQKYPINKHIFILDMMRKFELCFPIDEDYTYLIPDLLPREEIDTGNWENASIFHYHYPILPSSIISRFIVRLNQYISKNTYWRSGVVLSYEGKNRALIKADYREGDKVISIYVDGLQETRFIFLKIIRDHIKQIHGTIPKIEFTERVCLHTDPSVCFNYDDLIAYKEAGKTTIFEPKTRKDIDLKTIFNGIDTSQELSTKQEDKWSWKEYTPVLVPILGAIAALLTALGVPKIVEILMQKTLTAPSPTSTQSSPSSGKIIQPSLPASQSPAKVP